jgi:hypothetical protein
MTSGEVSMAGNAWGTAAELEGRKRGCRYRGGGRRTDPAIAHFHGGGKSGGVSVIDA